MRGIAGQPLPDTQSGFRVYPVGGDARARHARHPLRLRDRGPAARRARRHAGARRAGRGVLPARRRAREPLPAVGRHAAHHPLGACESCVAGDARAAGLLVPGRAASAKSRAMKLAYGIALRAGGRLRRLRRHAAAPRTSAHRRRSPRESIEKIGRHLARERHQSNIDAPSGQGLRGVRRSPSGRTSSRPTTCSSRSW